MFEKLFLLDGAIIITRNLVDNIVYILFISLISFSMILLLIYRTYYEGAVHVYVCIYTGLLSWWRYQFQY